MARTSRLEILIDTRSAEQKTRDMEFRLTAMQRAGDKAVAALKAIGADSAENLQKVAMATGAIPMGANPAEQALRKMARQVGEAGKESKATRESLQAMALSMSSLSDGLTKTNGHVRSLVREIGELARGNESVSRSAGGASKAIKDEIDAFSQLAGKIDPIGRKLDELDRQQKDLDQYRKSGTIEPETHSDLSRRIETERERLTARRAAMDGASMSERQMADEHERQMRALRTLQSQYDPVTAKVRALDAAQQDANRHRFTGNLSDAEFKRITAGINEQREALSRYSEAQRGAAMSAGQLRNAQRMLPAQFTDIVVSLQGGQRPLTVLLQQGGQLKDMFGGVGQAARAMGGYVAGLVNPFTIAAVAIGITGYALYSVSKDASEYHKALILTNNYAGTTAKELEALTQALGAQTGSISTVREAIQKLAADGQMSFEEIGSVAQSVTLANKATGQSVDELLKQYQRLSDEPVKGLVALDQHYHFLSSSQLEHIRNLEETGRHQEAITEAQRIWGEKSNEASKKVIANLDSVSKTLNGIKALWNGIWGGIKNGSADLITTASVRAGRGTLQETIDVLERDMKPGHLASSGTAKDAHMLLLNMYRAGKKAVEDFDKAQGQNAKNESDRLQAGNKLHDERIKYLSREEQKQRELGRVRALFKQTDQGAAATKDRDVAIAGIEDRFKEKGHKPLKPHEYHDDAGTRMLLSLKQQDAAMKAQLSTSEKLMAAENERAKFAAQISEIKGKAQLTADQKSLLMHEKAIRHQLDLNVETSRMVKDHEAAVKLQERSLQLHDSMTDALNNQQQQYSDQLAGYGQGDRARQQIKDQEAIRREFDQRRDQLNKSTDSSQIGSDAYKAATADIEQQMQLRLKAQQDFYGKEAALRGDWMNGVSQSWHSYLDQAADVAASTRSVFDTAFKGMEDSLVGFVRNGKLSFGDLANSILDGMTKIAVQQAVLGLAGMFGGSGTAALSSGGLGGAGAVMGTSGLGAFALHRATGGYIAGPGTATSDSIPVMLSDGEFVMKSSVVSQPGVREMLESMNSGRRYATGGYVAKSDATGGMPARWASTDRGADDRGASDQIKSDGTINQEFHFHGGQQSAELVQQLREAAQQGAEMGYRKVLNDFRTNGIARRMLG